MYFMNSDGTIKQQASPVVVKEDFIHGKRRKKRIIHEFNLFKRYPKCECKNCWKNFALTTVFYVIMIYLLYLIVKYFFSLIEEKPTTLTTPELPTVA